MFSTAVSALSALVKDVMKRSQITDHMMTADAFALAQVPPLALNLPGSPEGSAYDAGKVMDSIVRGVAVRLPERGIAYHGFVDMSGGSIDDATLGIAHRDKDGRLLLDRIVDQGQRATVRPAKGRRKIRQRAEGVRLEIGRW